MASIDECYRQAVIDIIRHMDVQALRTTPLSEISDEISKRLKDSQADLMVANDVGRKGAGFQTDTNEVFIVGKGREVVHIQSAPKQDVAKKLLDFINEKRHGKK
jgi:phosphopantothenoylcysteine synthetase/decarboxylase